MFKVNTNGQKVLKEPNTISSSSYDLVPSVEATESSNARSNKAIQHHHPASSIEYYSSLPAAILNVAAARKNLLRALIYRPSVFSSPCRSMIISGVVSMHII